MQSSVNQNAIKLTLQTNTSFLWKLPLALVSRITTESLWQSGQQRLTLPRMTTVKTIKSAHLTQIRPKSPCPWESGFRSQRFLLSLSSLLNRGHINTGTACRGYFQPFGQGIEKASLQQETSMENMCQEKEKKAKK